MRYIEERLQTAAQPANSKAETAVLAGCEDTDHTSQPRRIHVRNVCEVDDHGLGRGLPRNNLEVKQSSDGQGTMEPEDPDARRALDGINRK